MSLFGVFLVRIFPHLDWIQTKRYGVSLPIFSLNAGKYGQEKLRIRALFTQCIWDNDRGRGEFADVIWIRLDCIVQSVLWWFGKFVASKIINTLLRHTLFFFKEFCVVCKIFDPPPHPLPICPVSFSTYFILFLNPHFWRYSLTIRHQWNTGDKAKYKLLRESFRTLILCKQHFYKQHQDKIWF